MMLRNGAPSGRWMVVSTLVLTMSAGIAQIAMSQESNKELAAALKTKHVTLVAGIEAAAAQGNPMSAKYEYEDGKLQLSIYTEKSGAFSEVVVNHTTGKVATTDKITTGDDLKNAQMQSAALAKAKSSLAAALEKALAANKGYGGVSAAAVLKSGRPVAEIVLSKGAEFKTVTEPLD
jgi:hypothetical protein